MAETEVFRLTPVLNTCYEHAEFTRSQGQYPSERYFVNTLPRYVGEFIKSESVPSGHSDGGWRRDYFRDLTGNEVAVNYSYDGRTCFREVPCGPTTTWTDSEVSENLDTVLGGKIRKRNKNSKKKSKTRKSKTRKSKTRKSKTRKSKRIAYRK